MNLPAEVVVVEVEEVESVFALFASLSSSALPSPSKTYTTLTKFQNNL